MYTSSTLALAALETLVHFETPEEPEDLVAIAADIPEALEILSIRAEDLPEGWTRDPAPVALADLGTRWAHERSSPVLAVPSAVIPQELNYLLNPLHAHFKRIRVGKPEPFRFDPAPALIGH